MPISSAMTKFGSAGGAGASILGSAATTAAGAAPGIVGAKAQANSGAAALGSGAGAAGAMAQMSALADQQMAFTMATAELDQKKDMNTAVAKMLASVASDAKDLAR